MCTETITEVRVDICKPKKSSRYRMLFLEQFWIYTKLFFFWVCFGVVRDEFLQKQEHKSISVSVLCHDKHWPDDKRIESQKGVCLPSLTLDELCKNF
jgi:hypothetical protein